MTSPKIVANNLIKRFGEGPGAITALDGINLAVPEGEFVCILGPSGCGKSTLLFIAAGLEKATSGEIVVDGLALHTADDAALTEYQTPGGTRLSVFQSAADNEPARKR